MMMSRITVKAFLHYLCIQFRLEKNFRQVFLVCLTMHRRLKFYIIYLIMWASSIFSMCSVGLVKFLRVLGITISNYVLLFCQQQSLLYIVDLAGLQRRFYEWNWGVPCKYVQWRVSELNEWMDKNILHFIDGQGYSKTVMMGGWCRRKK